MNCWLISPAAAWASAARRESFFLQRIDSVVRPIRVRVELKNQTYHILLLVLIVAFEGIITTRPPGRCKAGFDLHYFQYKLGIVLIFALKLEPEVLNCQIRKCCGVRYSYLGRQPPPQDWWPVLVRVERGTWSMAIRQGKKRGTEHTHLPSLVKRLVSHAYWRERRKGNQDDFFFS